MDSMLNNSSVPAFAAEDQSGTTLWMFAAIGQIHRPRVWVDTSTATEAQRLISVWKAVA